MKLRAVTEDGNRFCGPAVVSALTGLTTGEAAAEIRKATGKRCVMGTASWELRHTLDALGFQTLPLPLVLPNNRNPTLAAWLRRNKALRTEGRVFLLNAGRHWLLISGRRYVCGITVEIVSVRDKRVKRRARVRSAWEVKKLKGGTMP